jgi:hypothetical protein
VKKVVSVRALDDFRLDLTFASGERRIFSAHPYLDKGIFTELQDPTYFQQVRVVFGAVAWPNEQDFSPETLYLESAPA